MVLSRPQKDLWCWPVERDQKRGYLDELTMIFWLGMIKDLDFGKMLGAANILCVPLSRLSIPLPILKGVRWLKSGILWERVEVGTQDLEEVSMIRSWT